MQWPKLHRKRFFKAPNSNTQAPKKLQLSITKQRGKPKRIFGLEVSQDIVSLEFGIYEIVLAGETGAILVLMVGLCCRRPDQLDRRAQLRCAK
jgi:hypothetical protein